MKVIVKKVSLLLTSMVLGLLSVGPAAAQYPDRPINVVIPFVPGGPSDVVSRLVATAMSRELKQPMVILNRPGAGGNIGMGQVANSKPDGYNILMTSIAVTQNPAVFRNMPYDPLKDLVAVSVFCESATLIGVSAASVPAKTLGEFIAMLKKAPPLTYNIAGAGGQRMTMEKFMIQFDVKLEQISYNSGGAAALALMAGDVQLQLNNATTLASPYKSGKVKILAVANETRLPSFPDVPTTKEAGFPDYIEKTHIGMYVNAGTPKDILAKLHAAARRAVASPEVQASLASLEFVPSPLTQAQADSFYREEVVRWREIARKANIPPSD